MNVFEHRSLSCRLIFLLPILKINKLNDFYSNKFSTNFNTFWANLMTSSFQRHVFSVKCEAHKFAIWEEMRRRERGEGWKLIKINTAHYNVYSSTQTQDYVYRFFYNWIEEGEDKMWIIDRMKQQQQQFQFNPPL